MTGYKVVRNAYGFGVESSMGSGVEHMSGRHGLPDARSYPGYDRAVFHARADAQAWADAMKEASRKGSKLPPLRVAP